MCSAGVSSVNLKPDMDIPVFPGSQSHWTERLELIHPHSHKRFPVYRVTDRKGCVLNPSEEPQVCHFFIQFSLWKDAVQYTFY
jgi:hypothetical protein